MANTQELRQIIENKRAEYSDEDQPQFQKLVADLQKADAMDALAQHWAMKEFLELLKGRIAGLNQVLSEKRKIDELERENMLDRKELYQEFINLFDLQKQKNTIEEIIKTL